MKAGGTLTTNRDFPPAILEALKSRKQLLAPILVPKDREQLRIVSNSCNLQTAQDFTRRDAVVDEDIRDENRRHFLVCFLQWPVTKCVLVQIFKKILDSLFHFNVPPVSLVPILIQDRIKNRICHKRYRYLAH